MSNNIIHSKSVSHGGKADANILMDIGYASWKAATLEAALKLEVWDRIKSGKRTAADLARSEGWDVTGIQRLLDALCALRLLEKEGNLYHLVPAAELYLLRTKPTYMGNLFISGMAWEGHGQLADAVRTGRRPLVSNWNNAQFATQWVEAHAPHRVMLERCLKESENMWVLLGIEANDGLNILDVACGSGIKSLALAQHHHGVRVTLQDWFLVLEVAKETVQELDLKNQITTLPGDVRLVDFGHNKFDVALLGHIAHYLGPREVVSLFEKVYLSLLSGGSIVVKEVIADEGRCKRENPLLSALWLYCVTTEGNIYTFSELKGFLKHAGFVNIRRVGKMRGESEGYIKAVKP